MIRLIVVQVMRDLKVSVISSKDELAQEETQEWKKRCASYVFGQDPVSRYKRPLQHRVSPYDFGVAVDIH